MSQLGCHCRADVGQAIAAYLRKGRPANPLREVVLRDRAPVAPIAADTVASTVRRACRRAGVAEVGSHRLRHTAACTMVSAGVPLTEVAQVLRQHSLQTTAIYANPCLAGSAFCLRPGGLDRLGVPQDPRGSRLLLPTPRRRRLPYANICETRDNFVPGPEHLPVLHDQLSDLRQLRADAERRGRVISALENHCSRLENTPVIPGSP